MDDNRRATGAILHSMLIYPRQTEPHRIKGIVQDSSSSLHSSLHSNNPR